MVYLLYSTVTLFTIISNFLVIISVECDYVKCIKEFRVVIIFLSINMYMLYSGCTEFHIHGACCDCSLLH